jgi:hypothetical protein
MTRTWSHIQGWTADVKRALLTTYYRAEANIPEIELMELGVEGGEKKRYWDEAEKEWFWDVHR